MTTEWDRVREMPTDRGNIHESVFRSYQTLRVVKEMLDRGDSSETIRAFIAFVEVQR